MKPEIHPKTYPTIFVDTSCGQEFITESTLTSEKTKVIDGVTYYIQNVEISSASHPFFTGKHVLIDTARRAEKFQERAAKKTVAAATRKGKKVKKIKSLAKKATVAKKKSTPKAEDKAAEK